MCDKPLDGAKSPKVLTTVKTLLKVQYPIYIFSTRHQQFVVKALKDVQNTGGLMQLNHVKLKHTVSLFCCQSKQNKICSPDIMWAEPGGHSLYPAAQSQPHLNERVECRFRLSGRINTHTHTPSVRINTCASNIKEYKCNLSLRCCRHR